MKLKRTPLIVFCPILLAATSAHAVLVSLNDVTPGTETVTLVANGGFELDSTAPKNNVPLNWIRGGNALYDTPANAGITGSFSNLPSSGNVAYINSVVATNTGGNYVQTISGLEPNTEYVYSAYLWNNSVAAFGSSRNLVMDFNDNKPGPPVGDGIAIKEVQLILAGNATDASAGYFTYGTFNTGETDTSFQVRVFGQPTTYTNAGDPVFAWDNVAVTKASDFTAPFLVPEPSVALLGGLGILGLLRRRRD